MEVDKVRELGTFSTWLLFKFIQQGDGFLHTYCKGSLLVQMGLTPENVEGKSLYDFLPLDLAKKKQELYEKAWAGQTIEFEGNFKGVNYITVLRPIVEDGKVQEVIGTCKEYFYRSSVQKEKSFKKPTKKLIVKRGKDLLFLALDEIILIERKDRKTYIYTTSHIYTVNAALAKLYSDVDERFIDAHRSYIINIDFVQKIKQEGKMNIVHFKNCSYLAKISKQKLEQLQFNF